MSPSLPRKLGTQQLSEFELKLKQSALASTQLTGWVYWQRDPRRCPNCWTKVFAVLDNAFLWLFQREESAPRSLLVQVAVASVERSDEKLLQVVDPTGEQLCICLYDDTAFERWTSRLNEAADLTTAFFRTSGLDVQDLPRWSNYRGTLEDYNRDSKRTRCRDAIAQMARRWTSHQLFKHVDD
ncbi:Liver carboxylesterase 2 [Phytophthora cinnamomi]|uniref:Liver carboxylesterase 2 n=1 Tax=Phytophthora cinnamomi TaxID=4785 RepID=UPI00355A9449|nr:Liver carboxylesterase 2 [Phytophthora cinnamomi]